MNQSSQGYLLSRRAVACNRALRAPVRWARQILALAILLILVSGPLPTVTSSSAVNTTFTLSLEWIGTGEQLGGEYGYAVAGAGDTNGDGCDDLLIGARRYTDTVDREGIATLLRGLPGGLDEFTIWTTGGGQTGARYGGAVSPAGDVDGDGYADILVGAYGYAATASEEGRAYLFLGSPIGLADVPAWIFDSGQKDAQLGYSVSSAGDIDNDGYDDIIVGARLYTADFAKEGAAFIFYGSRDGLVSPPDIITGGRPGATFGHAVASAGDVNHDGYDDIIVGAPQYQNEQESEGAAFLFFGSSSGLNTTPAWIFESDQGGAALGTSVASAGDLNHDGFSDLIIGAPLYDQVVEDLGAVFIFLGSSQGLAPAPQQILVSTQAYSSFGFSVASLGDINQDAHSDVVIGAPLSDENEDQPAAEGAVFIYTGSSTGLTPSPAWRAYGDKADTLFGHSVSSAGDIDGNGVIDLAVGAPIYRLNDDKRGRAYLYLISVSELTARLHLPLVVNSPQ